MIYISLSLLILFVWQVVHKHAGDAMENKC